MAFTELQIFNMALAELSETQATVISSFDDIGGQQLIDQARKETLAMHDWRFASKRKRLTASGVFDLSADTITYADADPDTIASVGSNFTAAKGFVASERIIVSGGSNDGIYEYQTLADALITLEPYEELTAGSDVNDPDLKIYASPVSEYTYKYPKPSDMIRMMTIDESVLVDVPHEVEGDFILTNQIDGNNRINISYVFDQDDESKFTDLFVSVMVLVLAAKLARPVKGDKTAKSSLLVQAERLLRRAIAKDMSVGVRKDEQRDPSSWVTEGHEGARHDTRTTRTRVR